MEITLGLIGLLIIVVLAVVAIRMTLQVKKMQKQQQEVARQRAQQQQEQREYLVESLRVISSNVLHEGLNLSEASIRCKMLLDGLLLSEQDRAPYAVIEEMYQLVKEFDTHQARKALKASERIAQDLARDNLEEKYKAQLLACFEKLKDFKLN